MNKKIKISDDWRLAIHILPLLKKPSSEKDLECLELKMLEVADIVDDNTDHPLFSLLEIILNHISEYENKHFPEVKSFVCASELVLYMMKQKGMVQNDLAEIMGSQGNVSKFLTGKRKLTVDQISKLSELFNISPEAFFNS